MEMNEKNLNALKKASSWLAWLGIFQLSVGVSLIAFKTGLDCAKPVGSACLAAGIVLLGISIGVDVFIKHATEK